MGMTGMELHNLADARIDTLSLTDITFSSWAEGLGQMAQMFSASYNIFRPSDGAIPFFSHHENDVRPRLSSSRSLLC
jgi:hypothetical protein